MTSPTNVGSVEVSVVANAKALAKSLRIEVEKAFKELNIGKAIQDSIGSSSLRVPVQVDVDTASLEEKVKKTRVPKVKVPLDPDTDSIPEKVKGTKVPKVPVALDPVVALFQAEVKRQTAALARQVAVRVPIEADGGKLRAELGTQLGALQSQLKIKVPTEPEAKAAYEAKLKAQLAEVSARVKQTVKVEAQVDVDRGGLSAGLKGLAGALPNLGGITSSVADLIGAFQKLGGTSAQAGGAMAGAAQSAAGPVGALVGVLALAAAAAVALSVGFAAAVPVLGVVAAGLAAVAGAAAAIPGALVGAGAAFGALSLGFKGISDAFKPKAGGGGGGGGGEDPAARARRIAGAERGVEAARRGIAAATRGVQAAERGLAEAELRVVEAQRRAAQMQQAINRARVAAKENIDDLTRSLAGARLSEEGAALGVTEALRALNAAKETGDLPDIQRADLEYRQAIQTLEEAKDTTEDLGIEQADAAAKGVEGSDLVQAALEDQAEALKAVKAAQTGVIDAQSSLISANDGLTSSYDGLKSAQDSLAEANKKAASAGGAGGALGDVVKLAPAAQRFVNAVKALKPAFEALRLDVQQRLFAGLDKTVTQVGRAWIPALRTTLGSYADTFNGFFRNLGAGISTPKFIGDIQAGAEGARKGLQAIGDSVTTSLVPAFGALSRASAPFLKRLGEEIAGVVTQFSNWVLEGERTGGLRTFFDKASTALHDIFTTGKLVTGIIGKIVKIILTGNGKDDKSAISSFNDGLQKINDWLADPSNQARIAKFFDDLKGYYEDFKSKFSGAKEILDKILPSDGSGQSAASSLGTQIGSALISGVIAGIGQTLTLQNGVLADLFINNPFSLIGSIKKLLGIKSPSTVMAEIGRNLIEGLMQGITDNFGRLSAKAGEIKQKIADGIGNAKDFLVRKGQDFATGLRSGMSLAKESVKSKAGELRSKVGEAFSTAGTFLQGRGQQLANGLRTGMNQVAGNVGIAASNLKIRVQNAFSNARTLLYGAGQAITGSLQSGIASAAGNLGRYLNQLAVYIKNNKGPIEKDRKLLFPEGAAIMDGLIGGVASKRDALGAELSDLTAMVGGVSFPGLDVEADAAISRSLAVASANRVEIDFKQGFSGDWLIEGLRSRIKLTHNGSVERAFGSA